MEGSVLLKWQSYGRDCTVAGCGTVMEGNVLLQAVAQLWKGVYCCRQWHSYGRKCIVAGSGIVMEGNVLFQAVA